MLLRLAAIAAFWTAAAEAHADADLFGRNAFSGSIDLRAAVADGETAFLDGGFGKARYGDETALEIASGIFVWSPRLSDNLKLVLALEHQSDQARALDLGETYVDWRVRFASGDSARLRGGAFFPPVSWEHDGLDWTVARTLTPSAANAWIAEEVRVSGIEATWRSQLLGAPTAAVAGLFGYNDTSGTLLAFRGWALHDYRATTLGRIELPPLGRGFVGRQNQETRLVREIDGRAGYYGQLELKPTPAWTIAAFAYDNNGDDVSKESGHYAWKTRFANLSLRWMLGDGAEILSQIMVGDTSMGPPLRGAPPADVDFDTAFVLVSKPLGERALSLRLEAFGVEDQSFVASDDNNEDGSASTLAYRWDVRPGASVFFEWLRIESDRPARARLAEDPHQIQTLAQIALRKEF